MIGVDSQMMTNLASANNGVRTNSLTSFIASDWGYTFNLGDDKSRLHLAAGGAPVE